MIHAIASIHFCTIKGFKSNVHNKVVPKGCIVEGYIAIELVTFYSAYLSIVLIVHNRPQRNDDGCKVLQIPLSCCQVIRMRSIAGSALERSHICDRLWKVRSITRNCLRNSVVQGWN